MIRGTDLYGAVWVSSFRHAREIEAEPGSDQECRKSGLSGQVHPRTLADGRLSSTIGSRLAEALLIANRRAQSLLELGHNFFVRRIHFGVGQVFFRTSISEGIRQALLTSGNILAAKHVEEVHRFQVRWFGLLHQLEDRVVSRRLRHYHGNVAADGGQGRDALE